MSPSDARAAAVARVEETADEMVAFAADLVRVPTVNPPGEAYAECAARIGERLADLGFDVGTIEAAGRPEHTAEHPRVNVIGSLASERPGPCLHLNGHFDVVPPGEGWSVDPFGGQIRGGRLYGRGSADMKAGLAAAVYAAAAVRESGAPWAGRLEVSGTVDEESGGFAGLAHLAETGRIAADRTDYVIIPEPFGPGRICLGHRGVYWFRVTARGRTGHGSMPFLGRSAIDDLGAVLERVRRELAPQIGRRVTAMPITPSGARRASINVNSVVGGQAAADGGAAGQTPCVADRAEAVFDRRFLLEERFEDVRGELAALLQAAIDEDPERDYALEDLLVVHPTMTSEAAPLVDALGRAIRSVTDRPPEHVASPGTYDQKHVARIGGVEQCVAYGPGELEQAHQPDESCAIDDIVTSAKVMAVAALDLLRERPSEPR